MRVAETHVLAVVRSLIDQTIPNDVRLYSVIIGGIPYQINVFRHSSNDGERSEAWFLSDDALLIVKDGKIEQATTWKPFARLFHLLMNPDVQRVLCDAHGLFVTDEECDALCHQWSEAAFRIKREAAVHRLLERRNDAKILFRLFGDDHHLRRVQRIDHAFKAWQAKSFR